MSQNNSAGLIVGGREGECERDIMYMKYKIETFGLVIEF